jgi:hypothetical protein
VAENQLLAYLNGEADETTVRRIRAALVQSAELRQALLEVSRDLDVLDDPATSEAFSAAEEPEAPTLAAFLGEAGQKPEPVEDDVSDPWAETRRRAHEQSRQQQPGFWERLRLWWQQPALAAALVFLLMVYPTAKFFMDGDDGGGSLMEFSPVHYLEEGTGTVRGEDQESWPTITVSPDRDRVQFSLLSETPFLVGAGYDLEVQDTGGTAWRQENVQLPLDPLDPYRIDFHLKVGPLQEGPVTIIVTGPLGRDTEAKASRHRFILVKE